MSWRPTIGGWGDNRRRYHVVLSKSGPRGGKRPALLDVDVWADNQQDAIGRAKSYLSRRLRVEVSDG